MARTLQKEIERLTRSILELSAVVEDRVRIAIRSVTEREPQHAERVIEGDILIDETEVDIEEECLKVLALHQPVAIDLRLIIAVLKINGDLERIGDEAVNISQRAIFLASRPAVEVPFDLSVMAETVYEMVRTSLRALVSMDADTARAVFARDGEVDDINREMYRQVAQAMRERPEQIESLINLMGVSRNLERIADHATNIAEDVIYMAQGEIVRHGGRRGDRRRPA